MSPKRVTSDDEGEVEDNDATGSTDDNTDSSTTNTGGSTTGGSTTGGNTGGGSTDPAPNPDPDGGSNSDE